MFRERPLYSKFIRVTLNRFELAKVHFLADVLAHCAVVEHRHFLGAAGQVLITKVFPELRLSTHSYFQGEEGCDYLDTRLNTRTTVKNKDYLPALWIKRHLLFQDVSNSLIYIGVAMEPYQNGAETCLGKFFR